MADVERLLCMGQAHGADPRRMLLPASGSNPVDRMDWTEIHFAMVGCTPAQRAIVYLPLLPEMVNAQELAALTTHLWQKLIAFEAKRRPSLPTHPGPNESKVYAAAARARDIRQSSMIRTALDEYCDPRTCRTCKGQKKIKVHIEGKGVIDQNCVICEAKGWRAWSDNRRARSICGDRSTYTARIAPGYEHVLRACSTLHKAGITTFKERLFGSEDPEWDEIVALLQARC